MAIAKPAAQGFVGAGDLAELCRTKWKGRIGASFDAETRVCHLACRPDELTQVCQWLTRDLEFAFATLIAEEGPNAAFTLLYVFYSDAQTPWVHIDRKSVV